MAENATSKHFSWRSFTVKRVKKKLKGAKAQFEKDRSEVERWIPFVFYAKKTYSSRFLPAEFYILAIGPYRRVFDYGSLRQCCACGGPGRIDAGENMNPRLHIGNGTCNSF